MAKPFTDLMIDLETMSTKPNAVILQIGWCFFDADNPDRKFRVWSWFPEEGYQISAGSVVDMDTMQWWLEHPEAYEVQKNADRQGMDEVVHQMQQVWDGCAVEDTRVWAKGTHFDITILKQYFAEPWSFRNIHDLRTAKMLAERKLGYKITDEPAVLAHDARYDAEAQARSLIEYLNVL